MFSTPGVSINGVALPAARRRALRLSPIAGRAVGEASRGRWFYIAKRSVDLLLASVLLLLLSPLLLAITIAIVLDTGWPVIFRHARVGATLRRSPGASSWARWELVVFDVFKFRSMVADADPSLHEQHIADFVTGNAERQDGSFKLNDDPRVTRVGRLIRATSLDELPQLVNVLRGEMSLVGPRPLPPYEVELYAPAQLERFTALSGLTGLSQVTGRAELSFGEMIDIDLEYTADQSLRRDLSILLRTVPAVMSRRGAG